MNAQVANTQVQHTRLEEPKSTMSGSRASHRSNEEDSVSESTDNNTAEGGALPVALDADDVGKADPYEHERVSVKKTSWAWEYIHILKNCPIPRRRNTRGSKDVGLMCGYVCTLCLSKGIPFWDSLISLHQNSVSNGTTDLALVHKMKGSQGSHLTGDVHAAAGFASSAWPASTKMIGRLVHLEEKNTRGSIAPFLTASNESHLQRVHALAARLIVNNKLPLRLAISPDLEELLNAASYLKQGTYKPMSYRKMTYLLTQMFATFVMDVRSLVVNTRALYSTGGQAAAGAGQPDYTGPEFYFRLNP
jgi:hypothetical protein